MILAKLPDFASELIDETFVMRGRTEIAELSALQMSEIEALKREELETKERTSEAVKIDDAITVLKLKARLEEIPRLLDAAETRLSKLKIASWEIDRNEAVERQPSLDEVVERAQKAKIEADKTLREASVQSARNAGQINTAIPQQQEQEARKIFERRAALERVANMAQAKREAAPGWLGNIRGADA